MRIWFNVDRLDSEILEQAIKNFSGNAENVINEYLHGLGAKEISDAITAGMPISRPNPLSGKTHTPHAKLSTWFKVTKWNLQVDVENTDEFYYLMFPAFGTRRITSPNDFFERGVQNATPKLIEGLLKNLTLEV